MGACKCERGGGTGRSAAGDRGAELLYPNMHRGAELPQPNPNMHRGAELLQPYPNMHRGAELPQHYPNMHRGAEQLQPYPNMHRGAELRFDADWGVGLRLEQLLSRATGFKGDSNAWAACKPGRGKGQGAGDRGGGQEVEGA